jgi:hypothetical protein
MANFLKSLFVKGVEIDPAGATSDQVLKYNGTKFVPGTSSTVGSIDDLSDVVITSPLEYESLVYNGTNWVNQYASNATYVRNAEATTLTTGTVVYLFGATGDHATVKRADNDSDATSAKTVGLVASPIAASENGPVVTRGYVDGINLSTGYASGDVLWLGEDGAFTKTKPTAPEHLVFVGVVVRATNNGIIYVATQNGYELDELHDVSLSNPTAGQVLTYNGSLWVANTLASGASITISDTPPTSPSAGAFWFESDTGKMFIYYDSVWVEINGGGSGSVQETTLTTNSATTITRFDKTAMRSGEFLIQVTQGSKYTVSKILLIHNGTTPTLAEYGVIELGATRIPLAISTSISGSDVLVQATVTDAATTSAYVKVISSLVGL